MELIGEQEYIKLDVTVKTKKHGEIPRNLYKTVVESYTMLSKIKRDFEELNIPIAVEFRTDDNGFFKDFLERKEDSKNTKSKYRIDQLIPEGESDDLEKETFENITKEQYTLETKFAINMMMRLTSTGILDC